MTEAPVEGPVPRFELAEWRELRILAGITGRGDSAEPFDLGLAGIRTPVGLVMDRWQALRESLPRFAGVVVSRQVHGTAIRWHDSGRGLVIETGIDGHGTATPGLLLAVTTADCIPIYLVDPVRRTVALLHAGWRGVSGGIFAAGLQALVAHGSNVENVLVHCGVGICGRCYEVGSEVFSACGLATPGAGSGLLDLRDVLKRQASNLGVVNISTSPFCSAHDGRFLSHRASRGEAGRMVAYLGLLA